ncbi:MAG: hypothetical protein ACXWUG_05610 [Polyangiales bacterium]
MLGRAFALPIAVLSSAVLSLTGCEGPRTKRDIKAPAREMTYDDACGLQDYFDERQASSIPAPAAADESVATSAEGKTSGEGSYKLDPMARRRFARMLREEYSGVEAKILRSIEGGDGEVLVHVRWWDAGQIRRLHPEAKILVTTAVGPLELPPNMCVSDLLFGDVVYAKRAAYLRHETDSALGK